jgi:integrase/recombinase XerD
MPLVKTHATFAELLQAYFTERLMHQRNASPNTIASHRDTFRLLLGFAQRVLRRTPAFLTVEDLTPQFLGRFLDYLEKDRGNSPRSRNVRLAAIHSFFGYVALQEPGLSALAQRVLAIPGKRYKTKPVDFLTQSEIDALLAAPDQTTWSGRRDRTLLLVAAQTGLRVSELVGLCFQDVVLGTGANVRCTGKGRKQRSTPLRKDAVAALRAWFRECRGQPIDPVFPSARGHPLSRDGVEYLLAKHATVARMHCPSLKAKRISPHVLRHSLAMNLLQHGVDRSVIALWLGHESIETTQVYLHANLELKEKALAKTRSFNGGSRRYHPDDRLLAFLQSL